MSGKKDKYTRKPLDSFLKMPSEEKQEGTRGALPDIEREAPPESSNDQLQQKADEKALSKVTKIKTTSKVDLPPIEVHEPEQQTSGRESNLETYNVSPEREYYLLSVDYNPRTNKAGLKLYDPEKHTLVYQDDLSGHRPYCYTDKSLQEVESHPGVMEVAREITETRLRNLLEDNKEVAMTKIVTPTPNDVPRVRDFLPTWESRIRYHLNYVYDTGLIPGMPYTVSSDLTQLNLVDLQEENETGLEIPPQIKENLACYNELLGLYLPIFRAPVPQIRCIALDIETISQKGVIPRPELAEDKISCVCLVSNDGENIALVLEREDVPEGEFPEEFPEGLEIKRFGSEGELLEELFTIISRYPCIVTFNGDTFDLAYLFFRARKLKVSCPINYNRRRKEANLTTAVHIDLYRWYSNPSIRIYAFSGLYNRDDLDTIAKALLGEGKVPLEKEISELPLFELIYYCWKDTQITLQLLTFDNYTPLSLMFMLARISHTPLEELVRSRVSAWIRNLVYFEHRRREYLIPNSEDITSGERESEVKIKAIIKDKKFKGATVIDPIPGVHFGVTVLDFASLYPSIISEKNLSYETMFCGHEECKSNVVPETGTYVCTKRKGLMSEIIGFLKDLRVLWLKPHSKGSDDLARFFGVAEKSMKVFVNASYGVLGSVNFPLYCLAAAEATTAFGRDMISNTIEKSQDLDVRVLYGDTDSVFLDAPSEDQVNELISWSYKELGIGLEVDKVYRYAVLSSRKKNYLGVYDSGAVDIKGLLGKKRNTPLFLQVAFNDMISILSEVHTEEEFQQAKERINEVIQTCYKKLNKKEYAVEDLAFTMQLTRDLRTYKVRAQHVRAARILQDRGETVKAGQLISFIKTTTEGGVEPLPGATMQKIDVKSYRSHVESTFRQIMDVLDLDVSDTTGQVNLMAFFDSN